MKKFIVIAIILLLVGGGVYGFWYYKTVYKAEQAAKYEVEETTEVETEEIAVIPYSFYCEEELEKEDAIEQYRVSNEIFKAMENSDAKFFEVESRNEEENIVIQVPKKEFERYYDEDFTYSLDSYSEELVGAAKGIKYFYNLDAGSIKGALYENINGSNPLFGNIEAGYYSVEISIRNVFDKYGGIVEYFNKHDLKLSCESIKTSKVGAGNDIGMLTIFEVQVKTDDCTGDMSDLGLFADKGETKTITTKVVHEDDIIYEIHFE